MKCGICFAATTLTSWHLLVTFCSLHVALCMKLFEHKPFDARTVMGFGVLNGISIGLLNLSLGFNSVGFYQVYIPFFFSNSICIHPNLSDLAQISYSAPITWCVVISIRMGQKHPRNMVSVWRYSCHSISHANHSTKLITKYCLCSDDKAGYYSLYCYIGNPFLQEEI